MVHMWRQQKKIPHSSFSSPHMAFEFFAIIFSLYITSCALWRLLRFHLNFRKTKFGYQLNRQPAFLTILHWIRNGNKSLWSTRRREAMEYVCEMCEQRKLTGKWYTGAVKMAWMWKRIIFYSTYTHMQQRRARKKYGVCTAAFINSYTLNTVHKNTRWYKQSIYFFCWKEEKK